MEDSGSNAAGAFSVDAQEFRRAKRHEIMISRIIGTGIFTGSFDIPFILYQRDHINQISE